MSRSIVAILMVALLLSNMAAFTVAAGRFSTGSP